MSNNDTATSWEWGDDYRRATLEQTTPHGVFRAVIERDEWPSAPEFFAGDPILDTESGSVVYGGRTPDDGKLDDTVARIADAYLVMVRAGAGMWRGEWDEETWERWLRVFHGGTVTWFNGQDRGDEGRYAALALPAYRASHGCADDLLNDPAEHTEWSAYVEGDVYFVSVQRAAFDPETLAIDWDYMVEDVDGPVGGHYGEEYAKEAALEGLRWAVDHTASTMLPMGVPA